MVLDAGDGSVGEFTSHTYCDECYDSFMLELDELELHETDEIEELGE